MYNNLAASVLTSEQCGAMSMVPVQRWHTNICMFLISY